MKIVRIHKTILDSMSEAVYVIDRGMNILYTNPAEEALLGYNPGELLGNNATLLHDLEGPKGEPTVHAILERLDSGQPWRGDLPIRHRDGTIHTVPGWVMNLEFPGKVYRLFVHHAG